MLKNIYYFIIIKKTFLVPTSNSNFTNRYIYFFFREMVKIMVNVQTRNKKLVHDKIHKKNEFQDILKFTEQQLNNITKEMKEKIHNIVKDVEETVG